ncbi:MAG: universal stress protein [Candidatus Rokuibacteriota bacterium]
MHEEDATVAHELEDRQEAECSARAFRAVTSHQNVPHLPRLPSEDRNRTGRVPGDGHRRASDKESLRRKQRADAEEVLADAAEVLAEVPHPVERLVVDGDPARQIVAMARSRDVDLVVLGARGLRAIGRLLLGSVSETVLHHVGRPVVIVRER